MDSAASMLSAEDRRARCAGASAGLAGLREVLWQVPSEQLGLWLSELDALIGLAAAARVAVTAEAEARGEIDASQAGSTTGWVRDHAPSLAVIGAATVAKAASLCRDPGLRPVAEAVQAGALAPAAAVTVAAEFERLRRRVTDEAQGTVMAAMVTVGSTHGSAGVRALRERLVARYGLPDEFQRECDQAAALVSLSRGVRDGALWSYRMTLDTESRAVIEAAISSLSAPAPDESGRRDPRPAPLRRAQALTEVCRRAIAAPAGVPGPRLKSTLVLTMGLADLQGRLAEPGGPVGTGSVQRSEVAAGSVLGSVARAGSVLGSVAAGELFGRETVRKHACAAGVIPIVLGSDGEVLEQGRLTRLVTPGQLAALWLRDRGCAFPGCDLPAAWTDAHHLVHWIDGGRTEPANLALLCGRHHTIVHRDRLIGTVVVGEGVRWDLVMGSYDRHVAATRGKQRGGWPGADRDGGRGAAGVISRHRGIPPDDRPSPAA